MLAEAASERRGRCTHGSVGAPAAVAADRRPIDGFGKSFGRDLHTDMWALREERLRSERVNPGIDSNRSNGFAYRKGPSQYGHGTGIIACFCMHVCTERKAVHTASSQPANLTFSWNGRDAGKNRPDCHNITQKHDTISEVYDPPPHMEHETARRCMPVVRCLTPTLVMYYYHSASILYFTIRMPSAVFNVSCKSLCLSPQYATAVLSRASLNSASVSTDSSFLAPIREAA